MLGRARVLASPAAGEKSSVAGAGWDPRGELVAAPRGEPGETGPWIWRL